MVTPIEIAHDYTHTPQFEKEYPNEDIRVLDRILIDVVDGTTRFYSASLPEGIKDFDSAKIIEELEWAIDFVKGKTINKLHGAIE